MTEASDGALSAGGAAALLIEARSGRRTFVPIRRGFLQMRKPGGGPAPLSALVMGRRKRALDLYLLIHALASTEPWDVALPARRWAEAVGMQDSPSSRVFISKTLTWLEEKRLISTEPDGNLRRLFLLNETGSGVEYKHPARDATPDYFKLPYAYWAEGWNQRLDLSATTVLLIALSLRSTFVLPLDSGAQWYGVSRDTIRRGLRTLTGLGILTFRPRLKHAPNSPTRATEERRYTLKGAFATTERRPGRAPAARPPLSR